MSQSPFVLDLEQCLLSPKHQVHSGSNAFYPILSRSCFAALPTPPACLLINEVIRVCTHHATTHAQCDGNAHAFDLLVAGLRVVRRVQPTVHML